MYNLSIFSMPLATCVTILLFRILFIKRTILITVYYMFLVMIIFVLGVIAGESVQNDAYVRYEKFRNLEANCHLSNAESNDSMFNIDIEAYKNSSEFLIDLQKKDKYIDRAKEMSVGLLFTIIFELNLILFRLLLRKKINIV